MERWVVDIDKEVAEWGQDQAQWRKWSIYRIPPATTGVKKHAYVPETVSFGPYHHGSEQVKAMEEHKKRALLHFLKRTPESLQTIFDSLRTVAEELKDSYSALGCAWRDDTDRFVRLMVVDGCFLLEILRVAAGEAHDYLDDDPVFGHHGKLYVQPFIRRDMLLLENQLPMLVLIKLLGARDKFDSQEELVKSLNKLILRFCNPRFPLDKISTLGNGLHVLDLHRRSLLRKTPSATTHPPPSKDVHQLSRQRRSLLSRLRDFLRSLLSRLGDFLRRLLRCLRNFLRPRLLKGLFCLRRHHDDEINLRSAVDLHEAGVQFKKSRTRFLDDISFKGGVLKLPAFVVDDQTESTFLNLIAFERCHVGAGNDITSFICFMDNIVETGRDISLLSSVGILQNVTGSDKTAATLFNTMTKDLTLDPHCKLNKVQEKVAKYWKKPWNEWRANLIHTYFRSPWAIVSVLAAVVLFGLTIVQTLYSILQYKQGSSAPSPS